MTIKTGKRGRKTIRSVERKRYADKFVRRFGMTRSECVNFKSSAILHGSGQEIDMKQALAYRRALN